MRTEGDLIKINDWLLPLSWIYGGMVRFRNWLFDIGLKKSQSFSIPIISVGNITVGGSGKTPHVEYLIRLLHDKVKIAVLSRGYKRKTSGYVLADKDTTMSEIGDEPFQMHSKFDDIYVAVDAKPKEAAKPANKLANGTTAKVDMKYLAGAITYNDENKIEFTLDTDANGKTAKQIYDIVLKYMSELTQNEQNIASRVALVNDAEHVIANTMDEWLVFSQSFISLDRTEFKYQLIARISDNHLNLSLGRIIYNYEEGRSTGFKEPAEEVISDKIALNKKQNDLAKIFGKFRRCTIDRKDLTFEMYQKFDSMYGRHITGSFTITNEMSVLYLHKV